MPELPEVETTRRGLEGRIVGRSLAAWAVHNAALRWPVQLPDVLAGKRLLSLSRRAKYLLFAFQPGVVLLHLGMSGSLRLAAGPLGADLRRHDHVEFSFGTGRVLRFNDPRRFGCVLWQPRQGACHPLLAHLGAEPLSEDLTGHYLKACAKGRRVAVKNFIMDSRILVGVGNIYAAEALFLAGIRPAKAAGRVSLKAYAALAEAIKQVLRQALAVGGTTLRDFVGSDGRPGYFAQQLNVYGRAGKPCRRCGALLRGQRLGARSTVYCPSCQKH